MVNQELFIVEILTRPDGPSCRRGLPKIKADAERIAANLEVAGIHTRVVPAEKYAFTGIRQEVETPDTVKPNEHRSRVE